MPMYEFCCQKCQRVYEELVGASDEKTPPCPLCGSTKTFRVISAAARGPGKSPGGACAPKGGFS